MMYSLSLMTLFSHLFNQFLNGSKELAVYCIKVALPEKIIKMILKLRKSVLKRSRCLMEVRPAVLPRNVLEALHGKTCKAFMQHWKEIYNNSDKLHPINSRAGFIRTGGRWRKYKTCLFLFKAL